MNELEKAIELIEKQQPKRRDAVWMVGEQLKDILRGEPDKAELVKNDLEHGGMSLTACEKEIAVRAKKNSTGNVGVVTPIEAEECIRKYFGLPARGAVSAPSPVKQSKVVDLFDLV